MFLAGISTRSLAMIPPRLVGRKISPTEISKVNQELNQAVEEWRQRDLSGETIKYLFVDGVNFGMRIAGRVELVPVLVIIGVTDKGIKLVIGLQAGDKESASTRRYRQLSRHLAPGALPRLRNRQRICISHQPPGPCGPRYCRTLSAALADRAFFQMDQTKSENQNFLWHFPKCRINPNLDCPDCLSAPYVAKTAKYRRLGDFRAFPIVSNQVDGAR